MEPTATPPPEAKREQPSAPRSQEQEIVEHCFLEGAEKERAQETTTALVDIIRKTTRENRPSEDAIIRSLDYLGVTRTLTGTYPEVYDEIIRSISETMTIKRGSKYEVMRRNAQDELMKQAISRLIRESNGDMSQIEGRLAVITFDVRGLKTVNDITHDHDLGDEYLEAIARTADEFRNEVMMPLLSELGVNTQSSMARIGGDEFSLMLEADQNIFTETGWTPGRLLEEAKDLGLSGSVLASITGAERLMSDAIRNEPMTFVDALNELMNYYVVQEEFSAEGKEADGSLSAEQRAEGYLFSNRQLEEHIGEPLHEKYVYRGFIGTGASTLKDVIESPTTGMYKRDLEGGETVDQAVSIFMGALRSNSDMKSYIAKARQNDSWSQSKNPWERQHYMISTRNDTTLRILKEKDRIEMEYGLLEITLEQERTAHAETHARWQACEQARAQDRVDSIN